MFEKHAGSLGRCFWLAEMVVSGNELSDRSKERIRGRSGPFESLLALG